MLTLQEKVDKLAEILEIDPAEIGIAAQNYANSGFASISFKSLNTFKASLGKLLLQINREEQKGGSEK